MDRAPWADYKSKVNASKSGIKVTLADTSVFRDPGKNDLMVVAFKQDYRSSNLAQQTHKRQYWVREAGSWRIAYEAPVRSAALVLPESYRKASR